MAVRKLFGQSQHEKQRQLSRRLRCETLEPRMVLTAGGLCITEFMASNGETLLDSYGESSDWIELVNDSAAVVDLSQYYLTDDAAELSKYPLPASDLNPGQSILIFASGRGELTGNGEIHANFKLSAGGEYLALVDASENVVQDFGATYPAQIQDISYGIDSSGEEGFFESPTPNATNGESFAGFVDEVEFSLEHGFYDTAQTVELMTATAGATIVYTTDGSDPAADESLNPTNGTVYSGPITVSETTIIRAAAFVDDQVASLSRSRSYIFTADVVLQSPNNETPGPEWPASGSPSLNGARIDYGMDPFIIDKYGAEAVEDALKSISTISISTDIDNLFSSATGIYSNAQNRGRTWERFSSVELIEPDGSPGFQVNAGLRIRGGFSRNDQFPKRSFRFFFRGEYGDSKLEYDFFGGDGAKDFDVLDLRTSQNYAWSNANDLRNTFVREVLGRDAQGEMGHPYTRSRYHHLYLNGVYWGLYQTQERVESYFGETYLGGSESDYDRLKNNNGESQVTEAADGNDEDWSRLFNLAQELADNPRREENYYIMQGLNPDGTRDPSLPVLLDVDNLIDYQLLIFHSGGFDSSTSAFLGNLAGNNWVALRNREADDMGFQFFVHDNEHSYGVGDASTDRTGPFDAERGGPNFNFIYRFEPYFHPGHLHEDLLVSEEYRMRWQDRVQKHLFNGGVLTDERNVERFEWRRDSVAGAIMAEAARWGDTNVSSRRNAHELPQWQGAVDAVENWLASRNPVLLGQLEDDGLHSTISPVSFNQHGGIVDPGFVADLSTASAGAIYYTVDGSDPRRLGGDLNPSAMEYTAGIDFADATTTINARVRLANGDWSALTEATFRVVATPADATNLAITEIHYHPSAPTEAELMAIPSVTASSFEFVEFLNTSDGAVDLTGVQITSPVSYVFPAMTIASGERAVLVRDQAAFAERYGAEVPTLGEYGDANGLSDGGDVVTLLSIAGDEIQSFAYDDNDDWPSLADGGGHSLQVIDLSGDYNDPLNWLPSRNVSGSPATDGSPVDSTSALRITEFNYNPSSDGSEFIEFFNGSDSVIDLTGVRLVEGVAFDFTGAAIDSLAPGEFALLVRDAVEFEAVYGAGLPVAGEFSAGSLSNGGERLTLFDADGNAVHDFVYDDVAPWAESPDGDGSSLEVVSTDGDYSNASNWQPSSVVGGTPGALPSSGPLACDYVGDDNGCDVADIDALYAGSDGAPSPLSQELIAQWLLDASSDANPLKSNLGDIYVLGDINLDGSVDSTDLGLLLNNFRDMSGPGWSAGDLNGDTNIDSSDLGLLLNNFGYESVAATVAEVALPPAVKPMPSAPVVRRSADVREKGGFSVRDLVFSDFADDEEDEAVGAIRRTR